MHVKSIGPVHHISLPARGCGFETRNLMPSCRGGGR